MGWRLGSVSGELANTPSRQYLEENAHLIEAILQNQNLGRLKECVHYQQQLQQNLIFLATHADDHPELRPLIFAPTSVAPERPAGGEEAAEAVAGAEARAEAATQEAERMRRLLEAVPPKPVPPTLAAAQLHGDEPTASTSDVLPP